MADLVMTVEIVSSIKGLMTRSAPMSEYVQLAVEALLRVFMLLKLLRTREIGFPTTITRERLNYCSRTVNVIRPVV